MSATLEDKEAWKAQYKLIDAARLFPYVIELVNEAQIHYEHVGNSKMAHECGVLQGMFMPLTEQFGKANRRSWEY